MNAHGHYQCNSMPSANTMSTFSALHLLRSYNNLLLPSDNHRYQQLVNSNDFLLGRAVTSAGVTAASPLAVDVGATMAPFGSLPSAAFIASHGLLAAGYHPNLYAQSDAKTSPVLHRSLSANSCASGSGCTGGNSKRQRGEKKPIPEDQKDEKYFERRKRNNQAAKKSRDARKIREDQIALRATMLEHENAILRAQILTLREEASSLRQMLLLKKTTEQSTTDLQMCRQT